MTRLSLSLLGGFEARLDKILISGFKTEKIRALLAYLAVEMDRPHRRQALAGIFWPGYTESSARANLRHALANLRQVLADDQSPTPFLLVEGETIQFNPASDHWLDVQAFRSLIQADQPGQTVFQRLEQALPLYKGVFLEGFSLKDSAEFDSWSAIVREELQRQALTALSQLGEAYESRGELENACKYFWRELELEPWREEAHAQLMRTLALRGLRSAALAQYAACRKTLAQELGVGPSVETDRLYEQIRAGEIGIPANVSKVGLAPAESTSTSVVSPRLKHNLPVQLTSFIGREAEIAQVKQLVEAHRLVTLTGSGGVGKTRLSIQVGTEVLEHFTGGVWFIDLAPLTNQDLVAQTVASGLGIHAKADLFDSDALVFFLQSRKFLLVLDNCEHLLEACAGLSDTLLRACPQLKILVTSQIPLGTEGEATFRLPSLSYPESSQSITAENLAGYSAMRLLVERARLSTPDYPITVQNAPALVRICQRLDGIPLALELAAARLNVLTAEQVADRLEETFHLLAGGTRRSLPRQQTLRTTIEWSYHLLQQKERLLLHRLSVFSGGCALEAVEAVCAADGLETFEILDLLTTLVNQSMLIARRMQSDEMRYSLLETVRQYAREKLSAEEFVSLSVHHCDYYLWLAEQAEPRLRNAERITWTNKLLQERQNMQQALEWASSRGDSQTVIRVVLALARRFWAPLEHTTQTVRWVEEGIRLAQEDPNIPPLVIVRLLTCGIDFLTDRRPAGYNKSTLDEIIALCQQMGPQADVELCYALTQAVFNLPWDDNDKTLSRSFCELCLEVARRLKPEDVWYKAFAYFAISDAYSYGLEEQGPACQYALESWRLFQQAGDRWLVGHLFILGHAADVEGDYQKAHKCFQEAFSIYREVNDLHGLLFCLGRLAALELRQGDPARARHAARLLGATQALGFWPVKGEWKIESWEIYNPRANEFLRHSLDPDELDAAAAEGAAMSIEEISRCVLEEHDPFPTPL